MWRFQWDKNIEYYCDYLSYELETRVKEIEVKVDGVYNTQQFILDRLNKLESFTGIGMLPAQPVFQQQYLPPANIYQHGYPTTPVNNFYQQQVTPDIYPHYPSAPNSYQPQYLPATQVINDPYQQHQSLTTISSNAYQQQLSVSSTTGGGQEQCPVSSNTSAITLFHQNDCALNASYHGIQSQDGHVNGLMPCKIKYHRNAQSALPSSEINKQSYRWY